MAADGDAVEAGGGEVGGVVAVAFEVEGADGAAGVAAAHVAGEVFGAVAAVAADVAGADGLAEVEA